MDFTDVEEDNKKTRRKRSKSKRRARSKRESKPKSVQRKSYPMKVDSLHVHCWHAEEVAHTRADICCRCGEEKPVGDTTVPVVGIIHPHPA